MATRHFPALGFDPAPGDPAALTATASALDAVGGVAAGGGAAAARLDTAGWTGAAGDGFRSRLAPVPTDLDRVARAHRAAAAALGRYGAGLVGRQRRAADLEARAAELRRRLAESGGGPAATGCGLAGAGNARAGNGPAVIGSGFAGGGGGPAGVGAGQAASTAAAMELDEVIAEARRLRDEHVAAAGATAAAFRAATDPPYERPGPLGRAVSGIRSWVRDHADVLTEVSTVLKGVSAALGTASLVPGMHFLAPLAIFAGGAATGIDIAVRVAAGRGSWAGLTLDAVLTVVPAGPVARAVKRLPGVARVLRATNRAIPGAVKGRVFRAAGNRPDGIDRTRLRAAAALIRKQAAHYGDDVIVQGSRAGWSARPASDIDIGLRVDPDRFEEILRDRYGDPAGGEIARLVAGSRVKGIVHARRAGMRTLGRELETILGCKVDISVIRRGGRFDQEPWLPL